MASKGKGREAGERAGGKKRGTLVAALDRLCARVPELGAPVAAGLLRSVLGGRFASMGPERAGGDTPLSHWPAVQDLEPGALRAARVLLDSGWIEARHDGGLLRPEILDLGALLVPGWRTELHLFGRPDLALTGIEVEEPSIGLGDLVLPEEERDMLLAITARKSEEEGPLAVAIVGAAGSGKTAIARALAAAMGRYLLRVHPTALMDPRRLAVHNRAVLRRLVRELPAVLLVEPAERFLPRPGLDAVDPDGWDTLLDDPPDLTVLATGLPDALSRRAGRRCDLVLHLSAPRGKLRPLLWKAALAGHELDPDLDLERLARRFDLLPGAVHRAVSMAARFARARGDDPRPALSHPDIHAGAMLQVRHRLETMAEQVHTRLGLDDLVVEEEVLDQVRELINAARVRETVFDDWGFGAKHARGRGLSILFDGEPGTGKTLSAEILAAELGLPLFRVSMANVVSKWVGETEKNLQRIFHEARGSRSILLFDEADALFSQRVEVQHANDRFANMEINVLLQLMEEHDGICTLTTNLKKSIDKAFERRLSFKIHFPFPTPEIREKLWLRHLPPEAPIADDVDPYVLARSFELSGGSIRTASVRAAYRAAARGGAIGQRDLIEGAKAECVAAGKLYRVLEEDEE